MDDLVIQPSSEPQTVPAESTVRKGRRGLARKKNAHVLSQDTLSTSHNTSVYSSCVSRGFHGMLGRIDSGHEGSLYKGGDNVVNDNEDVAVSSSEIDREDICSKVTPVKEQKELLGVDNDELIEIEEDNDAVVSALETLRSPTPPPDSQCPKQTKRRRMNKKLTSALNTLNKAKGNLNLTPSTPFSRSKRKGKAARDSDVVVMDVESPAKSEILIKVRYLSSVHRIPFKMTNPFHAVLTHLSQQTGQQERHLSLFLHDQTLPLSKTPKEVGLTVADIIECHCMKDLKAGDFGNETIGLLIQCSNSKRKIQITVTQRQPFHEILDLYAQQAGIDASTVQFVFDGDDVGPSDTPVSLEMDDGDILDLVPASTLQQSQFAPSMSNTVITLL